MKASVLIAIVSLTILAFAVFYPFESSSSCPVLSENQGQAKSGCPFSGLKAAAEGESGAVSDCPYLKQHATDKECPCKMSASETRACPHMQMKNDNKDGEGKGCPVMSQDMEGKAEACPYLQKHADQGCPCKSQADVKACPHFNKASAESAIL